MHESLKIQFLGTSTAVPDSGSDTVSFVINDTILVDTGWSSVHNLRMRGIDPTTIRHIIFTHMHHDHYLSLPSLLFYWLMKGKPLDELTIIGPSADLRLVVNASLQFLQTDRFYADRTHPKLVELEDGSRYENESFQLETCRTKHPVQGLCCKFVDKAAGKTFAFTGDTAFHPPIAELVQGCPLLIHECSLGPVEANPERNKALHSGAVDAGKIASLAQVEKLLLVHGTSASSSQSVEKAASVFAGPVHWPADGEIVLL
ncbi:MAG: hypothetical protein K0Q59_4090 [Paenibacillus sp.]|nr:hypothetical protein [Paenibacillus sp.]